MKLKSLLAALVIAVSATIALPTHSRAMGQARIDLASALYRMVGVSSNDQHADLDVALSQWTAVGVGGLAGVTSVLDLTSRCVQLDAFEGGIHPNGSEVAGDYVIYRESGGGPWRVGIYLTPAFLLIFDGVSKKFEEVAWQQLYRDDGFLGDSRPVADGRASTVVGPARSCRLSVDVWPAGADASAGTNRKIAFADPAVVAQDINWISTHPHDTDNGFMHPAVVAAGDGVSVVSNVFGWVLGRLEDASLWLRHSLGPLVWAFPPLALLTLLGTSFDGRGIFRVLTIALVVSNPVTSLLFWVGDAWRFSDNAWQRTIGRLLFHGTYGTASFLIEFFTGISDSDHVLVGGVAFAVLGDLTVVGKVAALVKPLSALGKLGSSVGRFSGGLRQATIPFSFAKGLVLVRPPAMLVVGRMARGVVSARSWSDVLSAAGKADRISDAARATDLLSVGWYRPDLFGQALEWGSKFLRALSASATAGVHIPELDRMLSILSQTQQQVVQHSLEKMGQSLAPYSQIVLEGMGVKSSGTALSAFAGGQASQPIPTYGADGYRAIVVANPVDH